MEEDVETASPKKRAMLFMEVVETSKMFLASRIVFGGNAIKTLMRLGTIAKTPQYP